MRYVTGSATGSTGSIRIGRPGAEACQLSDSQALRSGDTAANQPTGRTTTRDRRTNVR
jgi:hypothetical protein